MAYGWTDLRNAKVVQILRSENQQCPTLFDSERWNYFANQSDEEPCHETAHLKPAAADDEPPS